MDPFIKWFIIILVGFSVIAAIGMAVMLLASEGKLSSSGKPDLEVALTVTPDPVEAGSNLTYTVVLTNNGGGDTSGVVVTDELPPGLSFVSTTPGWPTCKEASGIVTCSLGNIRGKSAGNPGIGTLFIMVAVDQSAQGTISNTVTVTAEETETDDTNNTATVETTVK